MRRYFYNIITQRKRVPLDLIIRPVLIALSFFYSLAIKVRIFLYDKGIFRSVKLERPVVSIGNITWGGTGKTPLIEALISFLRPKGINVAVLTRGYGKDENILLSKKFQGVPVLSGKDRLTNAVSAQREKRIDIFLMDDGFQHMKIKRDIDLVTINATDPFGNKRLIPAGILREPLDSIKRANMAVITKSDLVDQAKLEYIKDTIHGINNKLDIFESAHKPIFFYTNDSIKKPLEYINAKKVFAVSGLADNSSFIKTLESLGALVESEYSYMDHHTYTRNDLDTIERSAKEHGIGIVITTEKDWIKLKSIVTDSFMNNLEILILKIEIKVKEDEVFYRRLSDILHC